MHTFFWLVGKEDLLCSKCTSIGYITRCCRVIEAVLVFCLNMTHEQNIRATDDGSRCRPMHLVFLCCRSMRRAKRRIKIDFLFFLLQVTGGSECERFPCYWLWWACMRLNERWGVCCVLYEIIELWRVRVCSCVPSWYLETTWPILSQRTIFVFAFRCNRFLHFENIQKKKQHSTQVAFFDDGRRKQFLLFFIRMNSRKCIFVLPHCRDFDASASQKWFVRADVNKYIDERWLLFMSK